MSTTSAREGAIASGDSGSSVVVALKQIFSLAGPAKQELEDVSRKLAEDQAQLTQRFTLPGTIQLEGLQNALIEAKIVVGKLNQQDQSYGRGLSEIQSKLQLDLQTIETNVEKLVEHVKESKVAYQDIIKQQEDEIHKSESKQQNNYVKALQTKLKEKDKEVAQLSKKSEAEVAALRKELAETKTRLSKLMGDRLSDKNPDIADLSDKNRPTKIAERFNELYDNQWTDAFETAEKMFPNQPEKKRIQLLIQLLMDVNTFCKKMFERHDTDLRNAVQRIPGLELRPYEEILKQAKALWRLSAEDCVESLLQEYLTSDDLREGPVKRLANETKDFTKECIAVCWLMVHQDPPVTFHVNVVRGEKFDSNLYKAYTKSGSEVDYIVWPALLLHEKGATLGKGVVQCRDTTGNPTNTDGELHATHKPKTKNEPDKPTSDDRSHKEQSNKSSAGRGNALSQSVREQYNVASMKIKTDLLRSLKQGGTAQEEHAEALLKELALASSESFSTPGTSELCGTTQANDKSNAASETQGFSLSHQNTSDSQLSDQTGNMTAVCSQGVGTSYLANQNYQSQVYSDPEFQSIQQQNATTANRAHLQQPNTSVPSQTQQHYEFDPLYSANVSNPQNFGVPSSSTSNQQQATPNTNCIFWSPITDQQQRQSQYPQTVTGVIQQPAIAPQATPNNNCISWNPTTNKQQEHSQYPQSVDCGIQQPAMAQAKIRPSEQYPQMLVPTEVEMNTYYTYLQYYGYNERAKYYMDWKIGKGVFDKCDHYIRWWQSLRGNYQ